MFIFYCKCNENSFEVGGFSEKNAFVFSEEIKDENLNNEMAEKMLSKFDGQRTDQFIFQETKSIEEILVSQLRRFIKCPTCGRIHIFWTKKQQIIRITYLPELEHAYGVDLNPKKIKLPYNNMDINTEIQEG